MSGYANPYVVAAAEPSVRAKFIQKTYIHLALAIAAFIGIEFVLFQIPAAKQLAGTMVSSRMSWFIVLGVWMLVSGLANRWALSSTSKGMQYLGLGVFVFFEAIIFLPILLAAASMSPDGAIIQKAAFATLGLFAGLTAVAFVTKKDFSFFRGFLTIGGFVALGLIVTSMIFNWEGGLGIWFSGAMVLFAGIAILYSTSNVIHHYNPNQYVAASLSLFANVALMFWYILQIFMSRD